MCPRCRGCVHRRCHPRRGTKATRRVASASRKEKRRTLQDGLSCLITLSVSRGCNDRVQRRGRKESGARRVTFGGWFDARLYTDPRYTRSRCPYIHGIPLTSPRRPISISIKGGAHVPLLENARGINDSATRAPYESKRRDANAATGEYSLVMLGYSAGVRRVIITGSRATVWEKTPSKLLQGPVPRIDDARPVSGTGLIVPRPSFCSSRLSCGPRMINWDERLP